MIGNRRSDILNLIINHYIQTGEPMGSKTLCQLLPYAVSSATIRNEMAALGELGFLQQRHTSGGRIPTKASYRYYVDNLIVPKPLTPFEKQKINQVLSVNASDPERLLADAAKLLADATGCTSFFSTVKDEYDCIQGADLIPVGEKKAMLVMLTVGGKIKSSVIQMPCRIDDNFRRLFYVLAREFFIGVPVNEINMSLIQSTAPVLRDRLFDMLPVLSSFCSLCKEASEGTLQIYGQNNLLTQEEFGDSVFGLLTFLAEKTKFEEMLTSIANSNIQSVLFLGEENPVYELKNTATAVAKFKYYDDQLATLGIIGSLRIDYSSILPRIDYIVKTCSNLLKEGGVIYE